MRAINTILPVHSPIRKLLLPRQRLSSNLDGPNIPTGIPPPLPSLNVPVIDKVAMQAELQLQRQMDHSQRALGQVLRVKNRYIIPKLVEPVHECNQVPLALGGVLALGDEARLLDRRRRAEEVRVLRAACECVVRVPCVMAYIFIVSYLSMKEVGPHVCFSLGGGGQSRQQDGHSLPRSLHPMKAPRSRIQMAERISCWD